MEVNQTYWLDERHPNFKRWEQARNISRERGRFVKTLTSQIITCKNLNVLDLGSGEGGTSEMFSDENFVVSFDLSKVRLNRQSKLIKNKICGNSSLFPFKKNSFDLIIMQDVMEHLDYNPEISDHLFELLKTDGLIYLSTPNRSSIINLIADPHWGFPIVSLFNRNQLRKYFLRVFRITEVNRNDIAELLSLKKLTDLFSNKFELRLNTTFALKELLNGNQGIAWSRFHLGMILLIRKLRLNNILLAISNDRIGIVNKYLTPAFYFILFKRK